MIVYSIGFIDELIGSINIVIYMYICFLGLWKFFVSDKMLIIIIGI